MNTLELAIKQQYDCLAHIYDRRWKNYIANTLCFFKEWVNISPSAMVLDVACGTGELERLLLAKCPNQSIVGVDISEQMLGKARQKLSEYETVSFHNSVASSLPFLDESFDVIVSANSFHYFSEPEQVLCEMRRVLKPGGVIAILDWCKDFWFCRLFDWFLKFIDPVYRQCYTEAQLQSFIEVSGLYVYRSQRIRFGLFWGLMAIECYATKLEK